MKITKVTVLAGPNKFICVFSGSRIPNRKEICDVVKNCENSRLDERLASVYRTPRERLVEVVEKIEEITLGTNGVYGCGAMILENINYIEIG